MNQRSLFHLVILMFPIVSFSQSFEWEGYGKGLSYLKIKDGHVIYNCCEWTDQDGGKLKEVNEQWIIYQQIHFLSGDTINYKIEVLDKSFDSLRIWCMGEPVTYYRPEFLPYLRIHPTSQYHFQDFKLEYIIYDGKNSVIEFNRYGQLRYADYDNTTLFEEKLDLSIVERFKELIKVIDINRLNNCNGWTNQCDNDEISFVFRNGYFDEFKFKAVQVPPQLMRVIEFFEDILEAKGHPVKRPRRMQPRK